MELYYEKFKKHLLRNIAHAAFFVIYVILFWFLFFTKGVYINDNFYKKSANINTITYTSTTIVPKDTLPKTIILKKQLDGSGILKLDDSVLIVTQDGKIDHQGDYSYPDISDDSLINLALQKNEVHRGYKNFSWLVVIIIYLLFFFSKQFSTKIYSFFYKNRAAQENYYRFFDTAFNLLCIAALIYLIVTL